MLRQTTLLAALTATTLLAACGGGGDGGGQTRAERTASPSAAESTPAEPTAGETEPPESASPAPPAEREAHGTVIKTGGSDFGTMLFDRRDQAIYLFDKESTSRPECYGACAEAWPPVLTDGQPQARGKVRDGLLGTTKRRNGSTQVTYAGHPLYFYINEGPNQVLCHNVDDYGGLWLVVQPDGDPAPTD